jgi:hypothetical protein
MLCKFTLAVRDDGILKSVLADLSVTAISHAAGLFDFKPCSATNDVNRPRPNSEMSISTHFEGQKDRA